MNKNKARIPIILLTISVAVLGAVAGMTMWRVYQAGNIPAFNSLIVLPEARTIADFELIDQHGAAFSIENIKGNWSLIFFGFTSCPDICPTTLYQLQQARVLMQKQKPEQRLPDVYLITVDPERDNPQKLSEYLFHFDTSFKGLTGDEAQLKALAYQLGITFFVEPHADDELEYNVDHSAALILLNPMAQLFGVLPAPHDAGNIAKDIMSVLKSKEY